MTAVARAQPNASDGAGIGLRLAVIVGLAVAWELVALLANDPVYWPRFSAVAARLWEAWLANPAAWVESAWPSTWRLLAGWIGAVVSGIAIGTLIGLSASARAYVNPLVEFLRSIPPPALLPLFIVLLGIGDGMKVAMIGFGAAWPMLLNTADGVASVDPLRREVARVYGLTGRDVLARIVLPSAGPRIFAGLRVSLSIAVILMVISELFATVDGIGFELIQAQRSFRMLDAWAIILLLGLIGYALNTVLGLVERRVLAWQLGATRSER